MTFQFAKGVAELIQTVGFGGKFEGGEHGFGNLFGRPAGDGGATGSEDVMYMLDLRDDRRQFAAQSLVEPDAEDLANAMGRQTPEPEFTASPEDLVDGEVTFEDEVATVLDLGDGVKPRQVHLAAFLFGELRPQQECPVVELLADDLRAQSVGGRL